MRLIESSVKPLSAAGKRLSGLFAELGTENQNGRIYPRDIYEDALREITPKIKAGSLLGECDHPNDYDEVRLSNVSHVIREAYIKGDNVYGTIELLDTPAGRIAQALVEAGIPLGISSRGLGNTRRISEDTREVTDLQLITWDIVADPSFASAVLTESAKVSLTKNLNDIERSLPLNESSNENQIIRDRIDSIKESLEKSPTVTENLVSTIGTLTESVMATETKLNKAVTRNRSLKANMDKLQESYNQIVTAGKAAVKSYEDEISDLKGQNKAYRSRISKLRESYKSKVAEITESYETELVSLRKQLAIEKRGMSLEATLPLLEGLTTESDINNKLDSLRHLNAGKRTAKLPDVETLTEGIKSSKKSDKLSKLIASI